jgi:hypothetical protein
LEIVVYDGHCRIGGTLTLDDLADCQHSASRITRFPGEDHDRPYRSQ